MKSSQHRAVENHRRRLAERGLGRYEVRGLDRDKDLVRSFAARLAEDDAEAQRLRLQVEREVAPRSKGGILAALRASPLVGLDLDLEREIVAERDVGL